MWCWVQSGLQLFHSKGRLSAALHQHISCPLSVLNLLCSLLHLIPDRISSILYFFTRMYSPSASTGGAGKHSLSSSRCLDSGLLFSAASGIAAGGDDLEGAPDELTTTSG